MKVVQVDGLNRDYQPEKLVTVSISEIEAVIIVEALNSTIPFGDIYYKMVPDDYKLNLQSMYDVTDEEIPMTFYENQFGLDAFKAEDIKINLVH